MVKLPGAWKSSLDYMTPDWCWRHRYYPFKKLGTDNFMTVSPGGNVLWVADPDVVTQITTRRIDFPKPVYLYRSVNLFGKNVVSTEGNTWRVHRKLVSPPFTEKNNHLVWEETLAQAQAMLDTWVGPHGSGNQTVNRVMDDTMRLSLHVISRAGFGQGMKWPTTEDLSPVEDVDLNNPSKIKNEIPPKGHKMSYTYALHSLLKNILPVMILPGWFMKRSPFAMLRKAHDAHIEWKKYMQEMVAEKKAALQDGKHEIGEMDIMAQLIKGQVQGAAEKSTNQGEVLTDSEVLGNAFVFMLAGHETAANSIHFSILYLALDIAAQRRLQKDLDGIFKGKPTSEWDYDRDLPHLFGGVAGAVLNEQLRLLPPVTGIPKTTLSEPQSLRVNGKPITVPPRTHISLCCPSLHRNPHFWPAGPPSDPENPAHPRSNLDNDLEEFKVDRWLLHENRGHDPKSSSDSLPLQQGTRTDDSDTLNINTAADTASSLYRPTKGSYVPFSEGFRACIGRRFAQVEVLAALAVIFSQYSVELAVDEYASDEEVEKMDRSERKKVWEKAAGRASWLLREGMASVITLQMKKGHVPVRFVRKGEERFKV
ncbi:MAG: hypothetical protein Q9160_007075 [Pyrenula sp. 1 TL-2023]